MTLSSPRGPTSFIPCSHIVQTALHPPLQLCYRTLFQDLKVPGANEDYLAAKFRDELMPVRCVEVLLWVRFSNQRHPYFFC